MGFTRKRSESDDSDLLRTPEEWQEHARNLLLNKLTRGPRSRAQLAKLLAERNVPGEIALELLDRFVEVGLIDDVAYASAFARDRRSSRGLSRRSLKQELSNAGIDAGLAEAAIEQFTPEDDLELATSLVRKRWVSVSHLDWQSKQRRLAGFLARRGFSGATVSEAIRRVENEIAQS